MPTSAIPKNQRSVVDESPDFTLIYFVVFLAVGLYAIVVWIIYGSANERKRLLEQKIK
jgi:hypothetical protein